MNEETKEIFFDIVLAVLCILALIQLTGCSKIFAECEPGESQACDCGMSSYINYCTMDGDYLSCQCYDNGGSGYETTVDTSSGTMTGGNQDAINELFLSPPEGNCSDEEVAIPGSTVCWRICPAGMNMIDGTCTGYPLYQTYQHVLDECKKYHPNYRMINMKELIHLLEECYPATFSISSTNFCTPYLTAPIRHTMQLPNVASFNTWVDEMQVCDDAYGQVGENCAWDAKFYLTTQLNTEFNFFRASAQYGSAMSSGICVR